MSKSLSYEMKRLTLNLWFKKIFTINDVNGSYYLHLIGCQYLMVQEKVLRLSSSNWRYIWSTIKLRILWSLDFSKVIFVIQLSTWGPPNCNIVWYYDDDDMVWREEPVLYHSSTLLVLVIRIFCLLSKQNSL